MTESTFPPNSNLSIKQGEQLFDPGIGIEAKGSDESFRLILETVLESLAGNLPEIRKALNAGDAKSASGLLHAIKGYVPLMCTDRVVALVTHVESVSKTAGAEVVMPLYASLEPVLEQLLVDIQAYIANNQS